MTYEESAALMTDQEFRGRVKVAALHYASYILGESPGVPAHNTRMRWAADAYRQPDMAAQQIHAPVVMDPGVQEAGKEVTDAALQTAVEAVVNQMI